MFLCRRSGLTVGSQALGYVTQKLLASPYISIYGVYCHTGDGYSSKSLLQVLSFLTTEMEVVNAAAVVACGLIKEQAATLEQSVREKAQENPRTTGATEPGHATVSLTVHPPGMVESQFFDTSSHRHLRWFYSRCACLRSSRFCRGPRPRTHVRAESSSMQEITQSTAWNSVQQVSLGLRMSPIGSSLV